MYNQNRFSWLNRIMLAIALCLVQIGPLLAAPIEIRLVSLAYPPYFAPDLPNGGVITEIVREAFRRTGYDAKLEFLPWARCLAYAKAGQVDGIFGVWRLKERESFLLYTDPMPPIQVGFYARTKANIKYTKFEDLRPYKIGVVQSYGDPPDFVAARLNTDVAPDDKQNLIKLRAGRVDLILIEKGVARYLITRDMPTAAGELVWIDPPVATNLQYVGLSLAKPGAKILQQAFNKGLSEMTADGTLNKMLSQSGVLEPIKTP
ncbi:substrate-binding periplasmic protein [Chitinimonas sp. BJB300]|uniref:substrate-binding periplasmic protein n=1 Tax=Chitinimonas sp. BJB300 TaxID=1559339 RepID=UPI000C0CAA67|nr:transporter substrate-binding domain-containing protein [Chitinimonas sp. BJB300]PHV10101.1 amino acid ABC transporter substrate-binding protein [Chitinimonas sp. BJB300]TSJ84647.1 amino acid ABC transporter substrate-binding protein [Chitinimonas sp. BJB300]